MRIVTLHSDFIEFEPKKKAIKSAELVEKEKKRIENCLVVLTAIEKIDEDNPSSVVGQAAKNIIGVAAQVKADSIVIYPWVHLTSAPSSPDVAKEALSSLEKKLKEHFTVSHAPFGWYKAFNISVKGHPLAELSRQLKPETTPGQPAAKPSLSAITKTTLDSSKLKPNDHRILGQNLDLFSFYNVAPGMVFWHPKGLVIRNELIRFWREEHRRQGYQEISTPQIMDTVLWKVSGHWDHYRDSIFLTEYESRKLAVKPMNCPGGILVYKSRPRSYRELPLRMSELGVVHRLELSGVLAGLFRVVKFTQDDAHIYCTEDQLESEIRGVIKLTDRFYKLFGFGYTLELSTRPEKAMGSKEIWDKAEGTLRAALDGMKIPYKINEGDGAFYGPKIDFHIKDSLGRSWQLGTIQLDFQMPERFDIGYTGEDGKLHRPIMLHRTIYGSLERFIGIMLEHWNGNLPLWLAPVQVRVLPFSEKNTKAAGDIHRRLFGLGYRSELDTKQATIQSKIRDAELQKIPYTLVVGDREEAAGTVAVRKHGDKKARFGVSLADFEEQLSKESVPGA